MTLPAASQLPVKALLIGAILIPFNAAWQMMGLRWDIAHPSMISLLYNTISWLFLLTIFSRVIKHVSPRFALSRTELLTIYVMLSLSTAIGGHMCVQMLAPIVSYAFAYATPENDWQALFWRYIPEWSSVRDKTVLDDFYRGSSSFYMPGYLRTWLFPLLIWSAFLLALFLVMLGINFIVRRQWDGKRKTELSADPTATRDDEPNRAIFSEPADVDGLRGCGVH